MTGSGSSVGDRCQPTDDDSGGGAELIKRSPSETGHFSLVTVPIGYLTQMEGYLTQKKRALAVAFILTQVPRQFRQYKHCCVK